MFHRGVTATPQAHTMDESRLVEPDSRRSPRREFLTATPGRLTVLAVVLIAAALAAGVATAAAVADRQQRIEDLRASAFNALDGWLSAHGLLQQRLSSGDFSGAARIAIGPEPSGATAHFLALDAALRAEITRLRAVEFDSTTTAYRALSLLSPGGAALGVLCALGTVQRVMPAATVLAVPNWYSAVMGPVASPPPPTYLD